MSTNTTPSPLTKQEMFNRAVRGLRSQGFTRCMVAGMGCSYGDGEGHHCAWGWVDTSLANEIGSVYALRDRGIGVAAQLSTDDVEFAAALQTAHDCGLTPVRMEGSLRALAERHNLTWPED